MDYETPQFFRVMAYAANADRDVVDMVSGNPDWDPPAALREALREYADFEADRFQYPPSDGLVELRAEIAERRDVDRERVVVTNGTGEANHLAMTGAFDRRGNEFILTDPVYPYYAGRANLLGAETHYVAVDEDNRIDPGAVRDAVSDDTAAVVVNTPNNPTGAVYPPGRIETLVEIVEAHDAVLICDEVYDHFDFTGAFESALAHESDHVVVTNGFSKSMAITGLRVGYVIFPPVGGSTGDLVDRARTRHMLTNVAGSRPAQYAVLQALRETGPDYYAESRELLGERIDAFTDALDEAGAEYSRPDGAFYVMARFEGLPGTMETVERLIDEAGVAGMPGAAFGESREDWLRFAVVTPRAVEGAQRLADYLA